MDTTFVKYLNTLRLEQAKKLLEKTEGKPVAHGFMCFIGYGLIPAALLLLSTAALVGNSYNPFMYFRF